MITRKNLVAILLAFCISSIVFVALPIRSQTTPVYDPWADVSGPIAGQPDGVINMRDIAYEITLFNTHGNPIDRSLNTIKFFEPNETYAPNVRYDEPCVANFTWIPENSTNNAILGMWIYFEYKGDAEFDLYNGSSMINGSPITVNSSDYLQYPVISCTPYISIAPNQSSYDFVIFVEGGIGSLYIRNIHLIVQAVDG
jgi:hypothetical protein